MKTKTFYQTKALFLAMFVIILFAINGCSKDDPGPDPIDNDATEILEYISNLSYDANSLLDVNNISGAIYRSNTEPDTITGNLNQGMYNGIITTNFNLEANFDEVAILRPTNGIIWPGALVIADQSMKDGVPVPITLGRAPITLSINLPGFGENGTIVVDNPQNSNVQSGIDNALQWWNNNAYQDGYVNPSYSSYQASNSYSSTQLSIDVGLNYEWAGGDFSSYLNCTNSSEKRSATMVYKQVFYTVTMDTPYTPASVFEENVTLDQVRNSISNNKPPAYVQSVSYGRIIMFKMVTNTTTSSIDLGAVLRYAGAEGTANSEYDDILEQSTIEVITIGGNAEAASYSVAAQSVGDLYPIISGGNAVYKRDNPGVPIAYKINYLKDNSLAEMGYTTDYTVEEYTSVPIIHNYVYLNNGLPAVPGYKARFRFHFKMKGTQIFTNSDWTTVAVNDNEVGAKPPDGAHDISVVFERYNVSWGVPGWHGVTTKYLGDTYDTKHYRLEGWTVSEQ